MPPGLGGPVEVALARATDALPSATLARWIVIHAEADGFRLVITKAAGGVRLWSRRGNDTFPEIAGASTQLPFGSVVAGELCAWNGSRPDFDLLTQRFGAGRARIAKMSGTSPTSFVAFDVLAAGGIDLRCRPWRIRQGVLAGLAWQPRCSRWDVTRRGLSTYLNPTRADLAFCDPT